MTSAIPVTPRQVDAIWSSIVAAASAPYRRVDRFAWLFAHGKLRLDPIFRHLVSTGMVRDGDRVLDIGCGQGLLASLLTSAAAFARSGRWPHDWPPAAADTRVVGIELMQRDIDRARGALGDAAIDVPGAAGREPATAAFICGDMREVAYPSVDVAVILDVLHYVDHAAQEAILHRVHHALAVGGKLVLRVGDQAARRAFTASQWVDHVVTKVRGHARPPTYGRTLGGWKQTLESAGFRVTSEQPMHRGTPFANILLVASLADPAAP